jgi:hypothetical protein
LVRNYPTTRCVITQKIAVLRKLQDLKPPEVTPKAILMTETKQKLKLKRHVPAKLTPGRKRDVRNLLTERSSQ